MAAVSKAAWPLRCERPCVLWGYCDFQFGQPWKKLFRRPPSQELLQRLRRHPETGCNKSFREASTTQVPAKGRRLATSEREKDWLDWLELLARSSFKASKYSWAIKLFTMNDHPLYPPFLLRFLWLLFMTWTLRHWTLAATRCVLKISAWNCFL